MIDFDEIEREIISIESNRDTSYATMERLAPLYCAMLYKRVAVNPASQDDKITAIANLSEFLSVALSKNNAKAWGVIDEYMSMLKVVNPKQYRVVLNKIQSLD